MFRREMSCDGAEEQWDIGEAEETESDNAEIKRLERKERKARAGMNKSISQQQMTKRGII